MSKKLKLNPDVSYFLGLYAYNKGTAIGVSTTNQEVAIRFSSIAVKDLGIEPNRLLVKEEGDVHMVLFYNTKLKKLMENALEERDRIFRYRNDYSAAYFAGILDAVGGLDALGAFFRRLETADEVLMERLGFHVGKLRGRLRMRNASSFISFVKAFSLSKAPHRARPALSSRRTPS